MNAPVLKTGVRRSADRGFESHPLRSTLPPHRASSARVEGVVTRRISALALALLITPLSAQEAAGASVRPSDPVVANGGELSRLMSQFKVS